MKLQEQINSLAKQISRLTKFNSDEIGSEKIQREIETLKIQADIVESVVDEYNAIIGG